MDQTKAKEAAVTRDQEIEIANGTFALDWVLLPSIFLSPSSATNGPLCFSKPGGTSFLTSAKSEFHAQCNHMQKNSSCKNCVRSAGLLCRSTNACTKARAAMAACAVEGTDWRWTDGCVVVCVGLSSPMADVGKKKSKKAAASGEEKMENEGAVIKPEAVTAPVDTSKWPLLLKV